LPNITRLAGIAALILTGFIALVYGGWVKQPALEIIDDLVLVVLSVLAAASAVWAARSSEGRARAAWMVMAVALGAFAVGEMIWFYGDVVRQEPPFPSIADGFFLVFPLGVGVALLLFRNRTSRESQGRVVLDGLIMAGSLVIVFWALILRRVYETGAATRPEFALLLAYPVGDMVALTIAAVVLVSAQSGQRLTLTLLTLGLTCMALADGGFAYLSATGIYVSGSIVDIGWVAGLLLLTLAAVAGRQATFTDRAVDESPGWASVWLPYTPLMIALIVATAQLPGAMSSGPVLPIGLLLVITVLARQLLAVSENRRLLARVADRAMHDPLTGLANRVLFQDRLTHAMENSHAGQSMGVLILDLNHFKMVNDTLGHSAGDELLRAVAGRICDGTRAGGIVARLGGDEFAVLIHGSAERIGRIANRIVESFDTPFVIDGHELLIRPSAGLSISDATGAQSSDELVNQADKAMYAGKRSGAVGVHALTADTEVTEIFDQEVFDRDNRIRAADGAMAVRLLTELRDAIDRAELDLVYQPMFDLLTANVVGVEALLRWHHPERGLIGPDEFLPLIHKHGLMAAVTDFVITKALDDVTRWQSLAAQLPVAVNLFAPSLADLDLPDRLMRALSDRGLETTALTVEITESLFLDNLDQTQTVLKCLRQNGIRIAIDDFGSGYSALSYLRDLSIDEVKLDREFIAPILADPRAAAVVRAVIDLSHELGLRTVAEGVENAETASRLREYGCDVAQGYFFSPPLSVEDLIASLPKPATRPQPASTRSS
jgi:diguanylate cyclase (GGDEF)-like protein